MKRMEEKWNDLILTGYEISYSRSEFGTAAS